MWYIPFHEFLPYIVVWLFKLHVCTDFQINYSALFKKWIQNSFLSLPVDLPFTHCVLCIVGGRIFEIEFYVVMGENVKTYWFRYRKKFTTIINLFLFCFFFKYCGKLCVQNRENSCIIAVQNHFLNLMNFSPYYLSKGKMLQIFISLCKQKLESFMSILIQRVLLILHRNRTDSG